jgi:hypothetical protein
MRRRDRQLLIAVQKGPSLSPLKTQRRSLAGSRRTPKTTTYIFQDLVEAGANINTKDKVGRRMDSI